MQIGIIILAAGGSSRMGGEPKQLLELDGQTLLRRVAKTALAVDCGLVLVVLGANAERLAPELEDLPVLVEVNKNWQLGMGSSLKAGLSKLLIEKPDVAAVILTLADQPLVSASHLSQFVEAHQSDAAPVVASAYNDTLGVPALFARVLFDDLLRLPDDKGAKFLFEMTNVKKITLPEAAVDIDSRQDYERLTTAKKQAAG